MINIGSSSQDQFERFKTRDQPKNMAMIFETGDDFVAYYKKLDDRSRGLLRYVHDDSGVVLTALLDQEKGLKIERLDYNTLFWKLTLDGRTISDREVPNPIRNFYIDVDNRTIVLTT